MPEQWGRALNGKAISINDLEAVARELIAASGNIKVWLFDGPMGSGKTTLIKAICKELGVREGTSSPTFSIVNEYTTSHSHIYHFDFYRLEKESEAYDLGVEEYFESGAYCFVEWPEKIPSLFPLNYMKMKVSIDSDSTRKIEYSAL
ncbi:MAG: tRNA (adenosine(37)-N6)-threonylcarbamoyltransferase complex ATPase subunit type 1 TsaE [Cyclobacteriaceae bacterium]|nr:tRNA (adenosine(37)-N6)-threonylcarbamoyltransferase complex ATPase subunit type 1 TsaE [Cyclobacteriaceae bacterium]